MTPYTVVAPRSVAEAQEVMRLRPGLRVLGGGTLLRRELTRGGPPALLDLSRIPAAREHRPGRLGAAVTMTGIAGSGARGLAAAAASIGNGDADVRARATLGGNCAPEVSGCVYIALLTLDATGIVLTADGPRKQNLRRWNAAARGLPLLSVRFEAAPVAFARVEASPRGPLPLCAVALRATSEGLACSIGYAVPSPRLVTLRAGDPWRQLREHVDPTRHEVAEQCLHQALDDLR